MTEDILRNFPMPPAAKLLGWRLISLDAARGEIEVGFDGKAEFANPLGNIQGGILAAMLDDTMGPLVVIMTGARQFGATIDLHVHYLQAVRPGPVTVKARMTRLGSRIAFMEGQLFDKDGKLAAHATCSASLLDGVIPAQNDGS